MIVLRSRSIRFSHCVRPVIRGIDATSHAKSADGEAARKMCIGLAA